MNLWVMRRNRFVVAAAGILAAVTMLVGCAPGEEISVTEVAQVEATPSATVAIPTMTLTAISVEEADNRATATPPATVTAAATMEVVITKTPAPSVTPLPTNSATPFPTIQATVEPTSEPEPVMNEEVNRGVPVPEHLQELIDEILEDVFGRTQAPKSATTITTIESVTWNDGSLGCPEPDMMYTMAIVEGHRILIDAAGTQMAYHTGGNRSFKYCANVAPPVDSR